eukprot:gene10469-14064_t
MGDLDDSFHSSDFDNVSDFSENYDLLSVKSFRSISGDHEDLHILPSIIASPHRVNHSKSRSGKRDKEKYNDHITITAELTLTDNNESNTKDSIIKSRSHDQNKNLIEVYNKVDNANVSSNFEIDNKDIEIKTQTTNATIESIISTKLLDYPTINDKNMEESEIIIINNKKNNDINNQPQNLENVTFETVKTKLENNTLNINENASITPEITIEIKVNDDLNENNSIVVEDKILKTKEQKNKRKTQNNNNNYYNNDNNSIDTPESNISIPSPVIISSSIENSVSNIDDSLANKDMVREANTTNTSMPNNKVNSNSNNNSNNNDDKLGLSEDKKKKNSRSPKIVPYNELIPPKSSTTTTTVIEDDSMVTSPSTQFVTSTTILHASNSNNSINNTGNTLNHNSNNRNNQNDFHNNIAIPTSKTEFCKSIKAPSFINAIQVAQGDIAENSFKPKVICASADSTIHVYGLIDGKDYPSLEGHTDRVISLTISPPYHINEHYPPLPTAQSSFSSSSSSFQSNKLTDIRQGIVVSGSRDEMIKIWDLESCTCLRTIHAHKSPIWGVGVTVRLDGSIIALSTSSEGLIRSWDGLSGNKLQNFKGHTDKVLSICVMFPYSERPILITGGSDKTIRIWELLNGNHLRMFEGHEDEIMSLSAGIYKGLSSLIPIVANNDNVLDNIDNQLLNSNNDDDASVIIVSSSRDLTIRVWDFYTGYLLFELLGHTGSVYQASIAIIPITPLSYAGTGLLQPGTPILISCSDDYSVKLWNLENGKQIKSFKWHRVSVRAIDATNPFINSSLYLDYMNSLADQNSKNKVINNYMNNNQPQTIIVSCGWDKTMQLHDLEEVLNEPEPCCSIS